MDRLAEVLKSQLSPKRYNSNEIMLFDISKRSIEVVIMENQPREFILCEYV